LTMTRDPRTDPQPGDILRYSGEDFPRRVLEREDDSVLVEMGARRSSMTLNRWFRWANRKRSIVVIEKAVDQEA